MKIFLLCLFMMAPYTSNASIGCMHDKCGTNYCQCSMHYVACPCPCTDIITKRGICERCGHYGSPKRGDINTLQLLDNLLFE